VFWSLVTVLALLPTMLWDAPLLRLWLAAARKTEAAMTDSVAPPAVVRLRRRHVRPKTLARAEPLARPIDATQRGSGSSPLEPTLATPLDLRPESPAILPVSNPGGPVGPGQLPQLVPLGPGIGPVVYPVGPTEEPPTSPPVTVAPVSPTPDPDPGDPPVIGPLLPLDPDDDDPTPPVTSLPVEPLGPIDPIAPLDPDARPIPDLPPIPAPAPVPEPSSWTLMMLGAGLLGAALRRRAQYGRQAG
jgi:hypothetical protein